MRSNLCFSVTETKNFLEEMRDVLFFSFFSFFFQSMDIWPSKFMCFFFLPRTCKRMIGGLLGIEKKEVCGDLEMQRKERKGT